MNVPKFIIFVVMFSLNLEAEVLSECGIFEFKGTIRSDDHGLYLVLNEKTKSEIKLEMIAPPKVKLLAYLDRDTYLEANLISIDGQRGKIEKFSKISYSPINPGENFRNKSIFLKEKKVCTR